MAKTIFDTKDGRTFEFSVHTDFGGAMVCYYIDEVVRPKWKFFRTTYRKHGSFWTEDFPSVREGLLNGLAHFLEEERIQIENRKKFADFEKSLDR